MPKLINIGIFLHTRITILLLLFCFLLPSSSWAKFNYKKPLKKWTRQNEVYQREDFYASMLWTATFHSKEFLHAKVEKISGFYDYNDSQKQNLMNEELSKIEDEMVFFVSVYTYNYRDANLTLDSNAWEILATVQGQAVKPKTVKRIKKPSPTQLSLYPYINLWSNHYMITFPKPISGDVRNIELSLKSPFAKDTFVWK
jgi:hypothetical protein